MFSFVVVIEQAKGITAWRAVPFDQAYQLMRRVMPARVAAERRVRAYRVGLFLLASASRRSPRDHAVAASHHDATLNNGATPYTTSDNVRGLNSIRRVRSARKVQLSWVVSLVCWC